MGFTLTVGAIDAMLPNPEGKEFVKWLGARFKEINQDSSFEVLEDCFPFQTETFELDCDDLDPVTNLCHVEVGWSWWDRTVYSMGNSLGSQNTTASGHMHAFWGVAVPFDAENTLLGKPIARKNLSQSVIGKMMALFKAKDEMGEHIASLIEERSGGMKNLRIGSIPRILRELDQACSAWGLPNNEDEARVLAEELYEAEPMDDDAIARCYALIVRSFLRYAQANNHMVWFIK